MPADPPRPADSASTPPPALITVRRERAAALLGMGLSTFDRHDAGGLIPAGRKVGGCKLWNVAELREWADAGCPPRAEWEKRKAARLPARR